MRCSALVFKNFKEDEGFPYGNLATESGHLLRCEFIVFVGTSQMAPILPLYICELGIEAPEDVARWSGIVFGCSFVTLAIFSPIWGAGS